MIDYEKLVRFEGDSLIPVMNLLSDNPNASIGEIQHALNLGYARVGRIKELLSEVGIYAKPPRKYKMILGEDGKRHRQYLPLEVLVSQEEFKECIRMLERRKTEEKL